MRLEVTREGSGAKTLRLEKAILIYAHDGHVAGNGEGHTCFASVHDVRHPPKGAPVVLDGRCLERSELETLLRDLSGQPDRRELMPDNVLCYDGGRMAWWAPSCRRTIYFSTADKKFNADVNGKRVLHPPLLFVAEPSKLSVFALNADRRPTAKAKIFIAPYCNLYERGNMCRGNIELPGGLSIRDISLWEKVFYDTQFTHSNLSMRQSKHPGGHNALWRELSRRCVKEFPYQYLMPTKRTLIEVINQ